MKRTEARVESNRLIADNAYKMVMHVERDIVDAAKPGQFIHIDVPGSDSRILRRPISINYMDGDRLAIVYAVVGDGTRRLTSVREGEKLDILAPLGNGFAVDNDAKKVWIVGGGIGVAPMLFAARAFADREIEAFLGYRTRTAIYETELFDEVCKCVTVTTDDLTLGKHRFVTEPIKERLQTERPDVILACGPLPMFRALKEAVQDVPLYLSMEQRMGCGMGGCYTCTCKTKNGMKRVCKDGPVFRAEEVEL